jgi:hypothetical protein
VNFNSLILFGILYQGSCHEGWCKNFLTDYIKPCTYSAGNIQLIPTVSVVPRYYGYLGFCSPSREALLDSEYGIDGHRRYLDPLVLHH